MSGGCRYRSVHSELCLCVQKIWSCFPLFVFVALPVGSNKRDDQQMSPTLPIYHEHQSSRLCAQHALNTLLQGDYFSAIDLAEIAKTLDEGEKEIDDKITQSQNMDDSGFFSSQVIMKALEVFNLSVIPIGKPGVEDAKRKPEDEVAFIANHQGIQSTF